MIYTVTFNPALDYVMQADVFVQGSFNRANGETFYAGGKGINVSWVLRELQQDTVALGFVGGFTGEELVRLLSEQKIPCDFLRLKEGNTRINVKIKSHQETELNAKGPAITDRDFDALLERLNALQAGDTLVLSGNAGASAPKDSYARIMRHLQGRGIRFVVDTTGETLQEVISLHPFLIKPNHHELGELFSVTLTNDGEIEEYARRLQQMGAQNVLVSMAGDGALLVDENGIARRCTAPRGKVLNSVGAGDSMVAGFLTGYLQSGDYDYALRMGTACGSATAFSEGLADCATVMRLLEEIKSL